ncbi:MAG: family finger-like protein [Moraxellaceae bacterium]|nr:family finger-like protein [Moraxellaceae bacterium]
MTDAKQTKCPHCGSTFRISDAQLAARGGNVRCGSCLQVFRADQNLVAATAPKSAVPAPPAPKPAPAPPAVAPAAKPKKKANDESWARNLIGEEGGAEDWSAGAGEASDDFGFNADDIDSFISQGGAAPALDEGASGKSVLFDDELSDQLEGMGDSAPLGGEEDTHRISENADESWAQDILSELETEEQKEAKKKYGLEIVDGKSKPAPKNPKLAAALGMKTEADAAPAAPRPAPAKAAAPAPKPADDFLGDDADVLSFLDNDDLSGKPGTPPAPVPAPAANPFSLERPLAHVDAPVELKAERKPVNWGYALGWGFLCLLGVVMLIAQYVFFNFETLAINPRARPLFEDVCQQVGCRLPYVPDPSKIRVEELVVRKHPKIEGALVVDAIVKNSATFPQPFPALRLRFSNNANEVVASRVLRPLDYLQGEARLLRRMPPETSMHISLEVVDPGKEAIAYGLEPNL